jgi:DNA topoisomerase IB
MRIAQGGEAVALVGAGVIVVADTDQRVREAREASKFHRIMAFAEALPGIRARIDADMGKRGLPREKVLATVVHLLEP